MTGWTTTRIGPSPHIAVDHMGTGDLVVFLHGIGGNRRNWHPNLAAFAPHWHAVAWDARGYGESDDYDGPLDFVDYARDLARVSLSLNRSLSRVGQGAPQIGTAPLEENPWPKRS